jgi:hypothetical protein
MITTFGCEATAKLASRTAIIRVVMRAGIRVIFSEDDWKEGLAGYKRMYEFANAKVKGKSVKHA